MSALTPSEKHEMQKTWEERRVKKANKEKVRRKDALEKAATIANHLYDNYQVAKVYIYGSLIWGKHFTDQSDIDIYIEGFPRTSDFWQALVEAEHIASPFPIGFVLSENASESLKENVLKRGRLL